MPIGNSKGFSLRSFEIDIHGNKVSVIPSKDVNAMFSKIAKEFELLQLSKENVTRNLQMAEHIIAILVNQLGGYVEITDYEIKGKSFGLTLEFDPKTFTRRITSIPKTVKKDEKGPSGVPSEEKGTSGEGGSTEEDQPSGYGGAEGSEDSGSRGN